MNQLRNPPAAVIALRELITQWRQRAEDLRGNERVNTEDVETEATLHQCADDLDALVARVEPQQFEHGSRSPDGDGLPMAKGLGEGASLTSTPNVLTPTPPQAHVHAREMRSAESSLKPAAGSEPADSHTRLPTAR